MLLFVPIVKCQFRLTPRWRHADTHIAKRLRGSYETAMKKIDEEALAEAYNRALALEKSGDFDAAAAAYAQVLALDPEDHGGAAVRLASMGRGDTPEKAPDAYVATLFDQHAEVFEDVVHGIVIREPQPLAQGLVHEPPPSARVLVHAHRAPDPSSGLGIAVVVEHQGTFVPCHIRVGEHVLVYMPALAHYIVENKVVRLAEEVALPEQRKNLPLVAGHQMIVHPFVQ